MRWQKVTLVGVGLLGGSLGLALIRRRLAREVVGFVRRAASIRECEKAGAVHHATRDLAEAVTGADLIILCTPIGQMRALLSQMVRSLKPGAIITDVGSVKSEVTRDLTPLAAKARAHFVGSHPMAGAEKTGVAAAREDLFENAVCVVTPTRKSNRAAVLRIGQLWKAVGSRVLKLTPERHDELVSRSSHLPHLVAAALANLVLDPRWPSQQPALCANGFRDTTRIASGSPEMWRDIALTNREQVARALALFSRELQRLTLSIRKGHRPRIERFLTQAKARRDRWSSKMSSSSPE